MVPAVDILVRYRELLRLISRLPGAQRATAWKEATSTVRQRKDEAEPSQQLAHYKELIAKIGYLRMITPRLPSDTPKGGSYVLRDGELVESTSDGKSSRSVPTRLVTLPAAHLRP
jgi:hypothetical protein